MRMLDFRSDTVTQPSAGMRRAMADAEVGDDVFRDDPTVLRLEATLAEMTGKESGLFFPTGTQSNLAAVLAHCQRGDEYIVGQQAHTYRYEAGGAAVLGSVQPQPVPQQPDGTLALADIEAAIKPDDQHFARTRLLALENTQSGRILPADYERAATDLARAHRLGTHLDGARGFNAAIGSGVSIAEIAAPYDSVSICLSKGLGAPVGTVLVGPSDLVARAYRVRKIAGGAMRQSGILAAAGLYALEHNIERLADDHARAARLAAALDAIPGVSAPRPDTNIILSDLDEDIAPRFVQHIADGGIRITHGYFGRSLRWVTHLDLSDDDIDAAIDICRTFPG